MPSSLQTAAMVLYALWCGLSSVQAATKHTWPLQQLPTEPLTMICSIVAAFVTALVLSLEGRWVREQAAPRSTGGLPLDIPHVAHVSPLPVAPRVVAVPTVAPVVVPIVAPAPVSVSAEKQPPSLSRKERRRAYNRERLRRVYEEDMRRERERLSRYGAPPSITFDQQPHTWSQHAPGTVFPATVPLATRNYYAPLSYPPAQVARPVSTLSFGANSAAPSTPYSDSNSYYASWEGATTPATHGSYHQWLQRPHGPYLSIPQWSANVPGLTRSPSSERAPSGPHTPAVLHGYASQCQILDDTHIEDFKLPSKYALDGVPCGTDVTSELKVDEVDLIADMRVDDCVTTVVPADASAGEISSLGLARKVADLSWVAEKEWHRPVLKRMARVRTAPAEQSCDRA